MRKFNLLDPIALTMDLPKYGLATGSVGTIVEIFSDEAYLVEFSDEDGETIALADLRPEQMRQLRSVS